MRVAAASKAASASCVHRWMDLAVRRKPPRKSTAVAPTDGGWKRHIEMDCLLLLSVSVMWCESGDLSDRDDDEVVIY